ncbi:hypothetical protein INT47_012407, partial [Mucor saturninus]
WMSLQFLGDTHIKEHQKVHIVKASRNHFTDKHKQQRFKDFLLTIGLTEEHYTYKEQEQLSYEEEKHIRLVLFKLLKQFHKTRPLRSVNSRMEDQQQQPQQQQQQQQQHNPFGSQGNAAITRDDLAHILNALLINNNNQHEPVSRVQIPLPPHYDGTRQVAIIDNWYSAVERYLTFNNFDETRWVEYAVSLLSHRAQLWWNRINRQGTLHSWEGFKAALNLEFKPQFSNRSPRDRLFELKQTQSVRQCIHQFQDILLELSITNDEAIDKLTRGLKDRARAHVLMQDPIDLEAAYQCSTAFESASEYGTGYHRIQEPAVPMHGPTPMDLSALQDQNRLLLNLVQQRGGFHNTMQRSETRNCFYCDKPGHLKKDCYKKKRDDEYKKKFSNNRTNHNGHNNKFRQQLNALLDKFDTLDNDVSDSNSSHDNDFDNKKLIDLAFGSQDSSRYSYLPSNDSSIPETDIVYLNNINKMGLGLPMYKTMVGGSDFKMLTDSGASTNYVHSKLVSHALTVQAIQDQAVETADGKQTYINQKITFRMFLGDNHKHEEIITAYVFDSKFDIILGRHWLKSTAPVPDWFEDSWKIPDKKVGHIKIYPIVPNKNTTIAAIQPTVRNEQMEEESEREDDNVKVDYLLSANQMARYLKKDQITECYVVNFIDQETGNSASITPIDPSRASELKIDQEWKEEFAKLYPYAFKGELTELPPHRATRDIIVTNPVDAPPIYHPPYRMSPLELNELKRQLEDSEKKGLIVPTASPYGFPILFVRKGSGPNAQLRMCCDFRSLNKITIAQRIPLPRIDECLDQLNKAICFSQIDLTSAFNQTRLSESDSIKAAISHRFGQHRFLVTPFGLKNSAPYFQSIIMDTLKPYIDKFVLVYVDDILIYSKSEAEHKEHVKMVLKKLDDAKFVINPKKSHFHIKELTFLGYNITKHGILPSEQKTEAVRNWPVPTNVQQVRQFLGLAQHYKRFIHDFSGIAAPITDLTAGTGYKTRPIHWTKACQDSFDSLKDKLCNAPLLQTVDMDKPFRIECDSSDFAYGAVLLQQDAQGEWKPLAYESKRYSKEERFFPAQERELLAILIALRKWRCFIDEAGTKIDQMDVLPDLLSRRDGPDCIPAARSIEPRYLYNMDQSSSTKGMSKPVRTLKEDPIQDWPLLYYRDEQDWPELLKLELKQHRDKFVVRDRHVYRLYKSAKDSNVTELKFIPFAQRADGQMKNRVWWPGMQEDITNWLKSCPQCQMSHRSEKNMHHSVMKPLDIPPAFSRWHLDFIGELPTTKNNNRWILVAVDYATNWPIIYALKNATGDEIVKFIYEEIVLKFGNPVEIFSDRGKNLLSKVLKQYMNKIRAKHTFTSAYHPRSNSKCERVNQIIKSMLKKYVNGDVHSWDEYIDTVTFACRIRKHTTTGHSPFFLVYGVHPRIPGDFHRPQMNEFTEYDANLIAEDSLQRIRHLREVRFLAEENMRIQAIKDKDKWDQLIKGNTPQVFQVGEYVLLRHESKKKLEYNWMGPYHVVNCNTDYNVYQIKELEGKLYNSWVHTDRLKPVNLTKKNINNSLSSSWHISRTARAQ